MAQFQRYIGIDYSGAETPRSSLKGLRVYMAYDNDEPQEVLPPPSNRKYWSRRGIAEWLVARLAEEEPTLVGRDWELTTVRGILDRAVTGRGGVVAVTGSAGCCWPSWSAWPSSTAFTP